MSPYESEVLRGGEARTKLGNANLSGALIAEADLSGALMDSADLHAAILASTDLTGANLTNANLTSALMVRADLQNANLQNANLTGADLTGAEGITNEELEQRTKSLAGATMPDGQKYEDWLKSKDREANRRRRIPLPRVTVTG